MRHAQLLAAALDAKASEHHLAHVCLSVTGGVLQKPDIRSTGQEDSTAPSHESVGESKSLGKGRAFLITTITIPVFKERNSAKLRWIISQVWIATTFRNVQSPLLIKAHCNRVEDLRLSRNQLNANSFLNLERPECLCWSHRALCSF